MNARRAGGLAVTFLALCSTPLLCSEEAVKSKSFEASPEKVYAAAEKIFEGNHEYIDLRDPAERKIRILRSQRMEFREHLFVNSIIFTVSPDPAHSRKTLASLKFIWVNVQPSPTFTPGMKRLGNEESKYAKWFFSELKKELGL